MIHDSSNVLLSRKNAAKLELLGRTSVKLTIRLFDSALLLVVNCTLLVQQQKKGLLFCIINFVGGFYRFFKLDSVGRLI